MIKRNTMSYSPKSSPKHGKDDVLPVVRKANDKARKYTSMLPNNDEYIARNVGYRGGQPCLNCLHHGFNPKKKSGDGLGRCKNCEKCFDCEDRFSCYHKTMKKYF